MYNVFSQLVDSQEVYIISTSCLSCLLHTGDIVGSNRHTHDPVCCLCHHGRGILEEGHPTKKRKKIYHLSDNAPLYYICVKYILFPGCIIIVVFLPGFYFPRRPLCYCACSVVVHYTHAQSEPLAEKLAPLRWRSKRGRSS